MDDVVEIRTQPAPDNTGRNILIGTGLLAALWFGSRMLFGSKGMKLRPNLENGKYELKVRGECIGTPALFEGPPKGYCPTGSVVWTWNAPRAPAPGVRLYLNTVEGATSAVNEATRKLVAAGWDVRGEWE